MRPLMTIPIWACLAFSIGSCGPSPSARNAEQTWLRGVAGSRVIYERSTNVDAGESAVYVLDISTGKTALLDAERPRGPMGYVQSDGTWVLTEFVSDGGTSASLVAINAETRQRFPVGNGESGTPQDALLFDGKLAVLNASALDIQDLGSQKTIYHIGLPVAGLRVAAASDDFAIIQSGSPDGPAYHAVRLATGGIFALPSPTGQWNELTDFKLSGDVLIVQGIERIADTTSRIAVLKLDVPDGAWSEVADYGEYDTASFGKNFRLARVGGFDGARIVVEYEEFQPSFLPVQHRLDLLDAATGDRQTVASSSPSIGSYISDPRLDGTHAYWIDPNKSRLLIYDLLQQKGVYVDLN
jgi:hypothetical protein